MKFTKGAIHQRCNSPKVNKSITKKQVDQWKCEKSRQGVKLWGEDYQGAKPSGEAV